MPDYEPSEWNNENVGPYHNCYDYATDHRRPFFGPGLPEPVPFNDFSVPGGTGDLSPYRIRKVPDGQGGMATTIEITCEGIRNGAVFDGLKELDDDGNCGDGCWKVAYYHADVPGPRWDDFHFARQDSDGNWSHKMGGSNVGRLTDPDPNDARPLPEKTNVVPGYTFCGYLCCCPGQTVAAVPTPYQPDEGQAMFASLDGRSGFKEILPGSFDATVVREVLRESIGSLGSPWQPGVGRGHPRYEITMMGELGEVTRVWLCSASVSVMGSSARHVEDPCSLVASRLREWLEEQGVLRSPPCEVQGQRRPAKT